MYDLSNKIKLNTREDISQEPINPDHGPLIDGLGTFLIREEPLSINEIYSDILNKIKDLKQVLQHDIQQRQQVAERDIIANIREELSEFLGPREEVITSNPNPSDRTVTEFKAENTINLNSTTSPAQYFKNIVKPNTYHGTQS